MTEPNYINDTFTKNITCPVCQNNFTETAVKTNSPRITSKDSDFFIRYKAINPYFYDVWICPKCGYAAMKSEFNNLRSSEKTVIVNKITDRWKPKAYPYFLDVDLAIERYKLALVTALALNKSMSSPSMISLKIAWMYRIKNDTKSELSFLKKALNGFLKAYSVEDFPIFGMDRDSFNYLIGELFRRTGNNENALVWYSKVIMTVGASHRVKELARNGKYLIKS